MATALDSTAIVPFRPKDDIPAMDEEQLLDILRHELENTIGGDWGDRTGNDASSDLSEQREKAIRAYYGAPLGNEIEGRSQVVLTEIADTIDWMVPSLVELFTSNGELCRFKPKRKRQKETVDKAAALVNDIIFQQNDGFNLIHDFLHDGLLVDTGILKVWYEDEPEPEREEYENLDIEGFLMLMETPDTLELIEPTTDIDEILPILAEGGGVDVVILRHKQGRIRIQSVASQNFGISQHARCLEESTVTYHVDLMPRSDLVEEMGIDSAKADEVQPYSGGTFSRELRARAEPKNEGIGPYETEHLDASREEVLIYECYMLVDSDGDGISEMMKIVAGSNGSNVYVLLDAEEVEKDLPFITWTPFRMPHTFYGQSVADKMYDIQVVSSTLVRLGLDNAYNVNINRVVTDPGSVNVDDLQTNNLSGIVKLSPRAQARGITPQNAVQPIVSAPILDQLIPMMERMDQVRRGRMGVDPNSQDTTVENLTNQASGIAINLIQDSARKKQQMVARHAANGFETLCQRVLMLAIRNGVITEIEVEEGEFERVDPGDWQEDMVAAVDVGLGFGSKDRETAAIAGLASMQMQAVNMQGGTLDGPLVRPSHIAETMRTYVESNQLGRSGDFVADPNDLRALEEQQDANPEPSQQEQMEMQAASMEIDERKLKVQEAGAKVLIARANAEKAKIEAQVAQQQPMLDARRDQVNMIRELRGAKTDEAKVIAEMKVKARSAEDSGKMARLQLLSEEKQKARDRLLKIREIESKEAIERMRAGLQRQQEAERQAFEGDEAERNRSFSATEADMNRKSTGGTLAPAETSAEEDTDRAKDLEAVQAEALQNIQDQAATAIAALDAEKKALEAARNKLESRPKQKDRQPRKRKVTFERGGPENRITGAEVS